MGSELGGLSADELGRIAVNALLTRTGLDPALVDETIFGCVAQPAEATNVARVIALRAGIPESTPAMTVQTQLRLRLRSHHSGTGKAAGRSRLGVRGWRCRKHVKHTALF